MSAVADRNLEAARADGTRALYRAAWQRFRAFADAQGVPALPASDELVRAYIESVGETLRPATLRVHAAAIAAAHEDAGLDSPTGFARVKKALKGHRRRRGRPAHQVRPIDAEAFMRITETAPIPRRTRGGRLETREEAEWRALLDVVIVGLMRDALLRRGEAAALVWADIAWARQMDGSGVVRIRASKTDIFSDGATRYISADMMEVLEPLRIISGAQPEDPVIGLSPRQICRRIQATCAAAGLVGHYAGHSPRIGMIVDLAEAGFAMPMLKHAGRWTNDATVMRYVEAIFESRSAVAQWYESRADEDDSVERH